MTGKKKVLSELAFAVYALVMLRLLLLRPTASGRSLNLVPFRTIAEYFVYLSDGAEYLAPLRRYAAVNLVGNTVLFLPLGAALPLLFPRLRRWIPFLTAVIGILLLVEAAQYILGVGAADVDDLLLNTLGAAAGFAAMRRFGKTTV